MSKTLDEIFKIYDVRVHQRGATEDMLVLEIREAIERSRPAEAYNATSDQYDAGVADGYNQAVDDFKANLLRELGLDGKQDDPVNSPDVR